MSTDQAKATALKVMERLDQRDLNGLLANAAPDARWHGYAPVVLDNDGYRQAISEILDGFPDSRFPVHSVVAEGNMVAVRHSLQGTHTGTFQGIPPTGKAVSIDGIVLLRVEDGKLAETWLNADILGLLVQLGVMSPPGQ